MTTAPNMPGPVVRQIRAAEMAVQDARIELGCWYGRGDLAALTWAARRDAAVQALADLNEAGRVLAAAREALAREIRERTDRLLAADETRCAAEWGVCPEHGNTLATSGGQVRCQRPGCGLSWHADRLQTHCDEPAAVVIADTAGDETRLCAGHWVDARARLVGARLVCRLRPVDEGRPSRGNRAMT